LPCDDYMAVFMENKHYVDGKLLDGRSDELYRMIRSVPDQGSPKISKS
jgi:hypothetical protein